MGSILVVEASADCQFELGVGEVVKDLGVEAFGSQLSVGALHLCVLPRVPGLTDRLSVPWRPSQIVKVRPVNSGPLSLRR